MSADQPGSESPQHGTDPALSFAEAQSLVQSRVHPVPGRELLALRSALGRVLDRPIISPADVPPHRNSAMDGYALDAEDLPTEGHRELQVVGTAWAGAPYRGPLGPGECVRIMTGAVVPEAADTVVMQETVERIGEDRIRVGTRHARGQNVRHPGEDIARGQELLPAGRRLGPAELGLLASLGIAEVGVHRRVRAAFFSSGDELRSIGQALDEGQIYDSNRYSLHGMLTEAGVDILDLGVVPDRPETIAEALHTAAATADLVLTTGGVSVGAADHLRALLTERGEILFSKVRIRPGRPVTFGRWAGTWYFGLPGNPVAAMVAFYQFARPAIRLLQGEPPAAPLRLRVPCDDPLHSRSGRTDVQRGILYQGPEGDLRVRSTGRQGSGVLTSMSLGNCFILLDEPVEAVLPGEPVTVEPFQALRW